MGGVGSPNHIVDAYRIPSVTGFAAANYFLFTEHRVQLTKRLLRESNAIFREDNEVTYSSHLPLEEGRVSKYPDDINACVGWDEIKIDH